MKHNLFLSCSIVAALVAADWASGQVLFYGGDFDGRYNISSEQNTTMPFNTMAYDDFNLSASATVQQVWGNFLVSGSYLPTSAFYEVRSGMAAGNGGTLVQSGTFSVTATLTGRTLSTMSEYQFSGAATIALAAGNDYWLGIAPIGNGTGQYFAVTTSGADLGPGLDPNPTPTGSPLGNGGALLYTQLDPFTFGYMAATEMLGAGTYDLSYGLSATAVPEPATGTLLLVALLGGRQVRQRFAAASRAR